MKTSEVILEPFTYSEDFESGELNGWASYPLWQDTAFDPWIRPNTIVPGDPNISIEQRFPAFWHEDAYAGAQKLLDMYMEPGSSIRLRYYLATNIVAEFVKVRLAVDTLGKVDCTIRSPEGNCWQWATFTLEDFTRENAALCGVSRIKVNAIAILAKIPKADPKMNYFLGIDDVVFQGGHTVEFQFLAPHTFKLTEWKPHISRDHYRAGDRFELRGRWLLEADEVDINVVAFDHPKVGCLATSLQRHAEEWLLPPFALTYPEGLYLATLRARKDGLVVGDCELTFYIAPRGIGGSHPRLWFDNKEKRRIIERLHQPKFKATALDITNKASAARARMPLEKVIFDIDQLPDENMLEGHIYTIWMDRFSSWKEAIYYNALLYALCGDEAAGSYSKDVLVKVCQFPYWLNPWFKKRGQETYYAITEHGHFALAYDLLYEIMGSDERQTVRRGIVHNDVLGCHRSYVQGNQVTTNTSNWVAMIAGGSLMSQAAIYGDGPDVAQTEPYFTGAVLKLNEMIRKSIDPDGAYGEGGYIGVSMNSWNETLPAIERVFKIDLSENIRGIYQEPIWSGIIKENKLFQFGDSSGAGTNAPWLLAKYKDPLLGWAYTGGESLLDVIYDTDTVPRQGPFEEKPVRVFREVGTTVFKSGWGNEDFVFVMRTGAFYNHQHLDQGSFWLADRGSVFIGERPGSHYWYYSQDPLFLPWFIQPVGHSTILINGNPQSQRVGDPIAFAKGFDDYAFIHHFLDGTQTAFSCGDIGRLYWSAVEFIRRNVLYLKPRTVLMMDEIVPGALDVDVRLLYQAFCLKDIQAGDHISTITKDGNVLHVLHLHPDCSQIRAEEVPHYIYTLKESQPLEREGVLTVETSTNGAPLIAVNLLTTTAGEPPNVTVEHFDGYIQGTVDGEHFACKTHPETTYEVAEFKTDALALTWNEEVCFAALCTTVRRNNLLLIESAVPITCDMLADQLVYCLAEASTVAIGVGSRPGHLTVNGRETLDFDYDAERQVVTITLPLGEGKIVIS